MTIPELMNCKHQGEGWCLKCVGGLKEDVKTAEAAYERLRQIMEQQVNDSPLEISDDAISVRPPHWAARAMAGSFLETLADAPNWQSIEMLVVCPGLDKLIVTVRRATGESPEETVTRYREVIDGLVRLAYSVGNGVTLSPDECRVLDEAEAILKVKQRNEPEGVDSAASAE